MFEKFGEFDSIEEINKAAEGLKEEGDLESLKAMAAENGIHPDDVDDYIHGEVESLVPNPVSGALAKIQLEVDGNKKLFEDQELISDWIGYIKTEAQENEIFARAVRRKGKTIVGCVGRILKWAFGNQVELDRELIKAAGVNANKVTFGVPGMRTAKKLIREYYLG